MIQNKCQIDSHKQRKIYSICLGTKCQGKRLCCQVCQNELHKDHPDQLVDVDYILNFIKTESKGPIVLQPWINQRLQSLQKTLNDLEDLSKLIREEMLKLSSLNVQQFCKDLGNKYNILKEDAQVLLSDQDWNKLTEDMLSNLGAQNCEIVQKDATDSFSKSMANIRDKLKLIQEEYNLIHINKEYFQSFKGPQLMEGHTAIVRGIDICKERNLLASGSNDATVKLWSLVDNTLIKSYANSGPVYDVAFSNQGDQLAFGGGGDFSIKLIDISDLKKDHVVNQLCGHSSYIRRLVFSNNSKFLISGSNETVRIWDLNTKKEAFQFKSEGYVYGVAINADDSMIASNSSDGKIKIWNLEEKKQLCSQAAHNNGSGISFSRNQKMLVSSGCDGITKLWSLEQLQNQSKLILIREFKVATINKYVWTVLFSPCSRFIIQICNEDGEIKILDSQTGELLQMFKSNQTNNQNVVGLSISKDMDIIAYPENSNIAVWRNQQ